MLLIKNFNFFLGRILSMLNTKERAHICQLTSIVRDLKLIVLQKRILSILNGRIPIQHHVPGFKQGSRISVRILNILLCPEHILRARQSPQLIYRSLQGMTVLICRCGRADCFLAGFLNGQFTKQRFIEYTDNLQLFFIQDCEFHRVSRTGQAGIICLHIHLFQLDAVFRSLIIFPDIQMIVVSFRAYQFL